MVFRLIKYAEVESTNITAKNIINNLKSDSHGCVITAKIQTNGRGRYDREWISNEGNIFVSIILQKKKLPFEHINLLPLISSIFLHDVLSNYVSNCKIKWPNDILVNRKKISGLLIESLKADGKIYYIVGIGINNISFPKDMLYGATSLKYEAVNVSNEDIIEKLMNRFLTIDNANSFVSDNSKIIKSWKEKASGIGQKIEVKQVDNIIKGIFQDIDKYGNLILEKENKERKNKEMVSISAGDIFILD